MSNKKQSRSYSVAKHFAIVSPKGAGEHYMMGCGLCLSSDLDVGLSLGHGAKVLKDLVAEAVLEVLEPGARLFVNGVVQLLQLCQLLVVAHLSINQSTHFNHTRGTLGLKAGWSRENENYIDHSVAFARTPHYHNPLTDGL